MAVYFLGSGNGSITGTAGDDIYIIDPNALGNWTLTDPGGQDRLIILDRNDRDSGDFELAGNTLTWRNYEGDAVKINLLTGNAGLIEILEWQRHPDDGEPYSKPNTVAIDLASFGANVEVAGTAGDDVITCPSFGGYVGGWSEVYGNAGNDSMTGSPDHAYILLGGAGNDTLIGIGGTWDTFDGDAGTDLVRGAGGADALNGGPGRDRLFGDGGSDKLEGDGGDDRLTGGQGADRFVFRPGNGRDTILDFQAALDRIELQGVAPETVSITQAGTDVRVAYEGASEILILNAQVGNIDIAFV